ncbi:nuclear transport factor 2 family protein [Streptomyces olivaceoviridis]|uniref:Nuclear transport factor 2 family protein n=1 Tax=Streptomyces olivaceoviridis TaxID=1921 RepID=A0ABW7V938_STROI|nr:nuclear transport factor 2 family protein [Streptomyces corchorusii]
MDADSRIRASVEEHWRASDRGDVEAEHALYATDAMLDCSQSGERFRGRGTIAAQAAGTRPTGTVSSPTTARLRTR